LNKFNQASTIASQPLSGIRLVPPYLRALRSANFRLYFAGQTISLAGTWMQQAAILWLAYRLSGSAFMLGATGFASQIPILLFSAIGGVWIDRIDRRTLLLCTQSLSMLVSVLLAALTWFALMSPQMLLILAFALGCMNAIDVPARQTIAAQLVETPGDLQNAIALNSIVIQLGRFIGPALAGAVVAVSSEATCFLINAGSYIPALSALLVIRTKFSAGKPTPTLRALAEGIDYVRNHAHIRLSLLLIAAISLFAMPYSVLMPLIAKQIFSGDARTYGSLVASAGVGSLLAALLLATLKDTHRLQAWIGFAAGSVGISLVLFAANSSIMIAYVLLPVLGFNSIIVFSGSNTLIQMRVAEQFRGRVMAIFTVAFLGVAPLGNFAAGALAELIGKQIGVRVTLLICGMVAMVAAALYQRAVVRLSAD
jgi:MFS family permease